MEVSFCSLLILAVPTIIVCGGLVAVFWPSFTLVEVCKYIFTDRPITLGSLFSVALVALLLLSGNAVRVVPCSGGMAAKAHQPVQVASVCTCGCGRHK